MKDDDLPELKQEVAALRKLCYLLLEQNEAIKAELSGIKQQFETKMPFGSNLSQEYETKQVFDSPSMPTVEVTQTFGSLSLHKSESKETIDSPSLSQLESEQSLDSLSTNNVAANETFGSLSLSHDEAKELLDSNTTPGWGTNEKTEAELPPPQTETTPVHPLPLRLNMSSENIYPLASHLLMAGFGGGKNYTVEAAAKLLLHFYNEQPGEYKYLRRLTAYSKGGLAKLLMRLRQQGYLIKSGFQQHAVTGKSLMLMQQAACK